MSMQETEQENRKIPKLLDVLVRTRRSRLILSSTVKAIIDVFFDYSTWKFLVTHGALQFDFHVDISIKPATSTRKKRRAVQKACRTRFPGKQGGET